MKYLVYLGILFIVSVRCTSPDNVREVGKFSIKKIDTLGLLTNTIWNFAISPSDTNLYRYNGQPLYFKDKAAYFFDQKIAELALKGDTIILRDTSYLQLQNNKFKPIVESFLIGKIEKFSKDSLVIKKIQGKGNLFYFNKEYRFYNDSTNNRPSIKLNRIVYSTSTCYGRCPAMAIEINSDGNYRFFGGKHSKHLGNYKGKLAKQSMVEIEKALSFANIEIQPVSFPVPIDAPMNELIVYYNDSLKKEIRGFISDYPPRLQKALDLIHNSHKKVNMQAVNEELTFETKAHKKEF